MKAHLAAIAVVLASADVAYTPHWQPPSMAPKPVAVSVVPKHIPTTPEQPMLEKLFPECLNKDSCVVKKNLGGEMREFQQAARELLMSPKLVVVVDGFCASGCAIFADAAREKVCITERSAFLFHKGKNVRPMVVAGKPIYVVESYFDPPQSKDIDGWVRKEGGYPEKGFRPMPYSVASRIWKTCELKPPLPRPRPAAETLQKSYKKKAKR